MKLKPYVKEELRKKLLDSIKHEKERVIITSAYDLSKEDMDFLFKKYPTLKNSNIEVIIDPNIVAGLKIQIGSSVIDMTLLNELQNLKQSLYEITW